MTISDHVKDVKETMMYFISLIQHSIPFQSQEKFGNRCNTSSLGTVNFFILQIGIDIVTMPTSNKGNKYIITCMDYFSKWPEAVPSKDKSATSVAIFIFETICR